METRPNANELIRQFIAEGMTHPEALAKATRLVREWAVKNGFVK